MTDVVIPKWMAIPENTNIFDFPKNELLASGPGNEPKDYFRAIFDDDFLDLVVRETNIYAEAVLFCKNMSESLRITRWKPVTPMEMLTLTGLVLYTGTIKLNQLNDYWKLHPLFNFKYLS